MKQLLIVIIFFVAGCTGNDKQASEESVVTNENINGEVLFKANCISCHKLDKDIDGLILKGALKRWDGDKKAMYDFIRDPSQNTSEYIIALKKKWSPTLMTPFPDLTNAEIDAIMQYVENK